MSKFKQIALITSLAGMGLGSTAALAADAAPPAPKSVPSISEILDASGITVNGYVDVSYSHLSGNGKFINGVYDRVFDYEPNSFTLQQTALTVAMQPKQGFGGLVNLTAGKDAQVIKAWDGGTVAPDTSHSFDVTQAYVSYAGGPFTVIAGKFVTLAGAEVINPTQDVNFSRSILFGYAIPFTHTGLRASYAVNDMLTLIAGVNNGWDDLKDTNRAKTVELGVTFAPNKMFSFAATGYSGKEQVASPTDTTQGKRSIFDLVATFNATDQLSFVLNYDNGSQDNVTLPNGKVGKAKWEGTAGYVNYQINEKWRLSLRGEYFNDKGGYRTAFVGTTVGQKWKEGTFTVAYMPTKNVELRGEARHDTSDQLVFFGSNGVTPVKKQTSFGLEAIYKF